jgi:NADH:ubiquinone oxidoreductase subunit E
MVTSELMTGKFGVEQALYNALDEFIASQDYSPDSLIEVLHRAQDMFGYLRNDVLQHVAHRLSLPLARVYGVATFYHLFHLKPKGKYEIHVCTGTACYVRGADRLIAGLEKTLGVKLDETTSDGLFTLTDARCIGSCGLAPAMAIDEDVYGRVETKEIRKILRKYR